MPGDIVNENQNEQIGGMLSLNLDRMSKEVSRSVHKDNAIAVDDKNIHFENVKTLMKQKVLRELDAQTKRINDVEKAKNQKEALLWEIDIKKMR